MNANDKKRADREYRTWFGLRKAKRGRVHIVEKPGVVREGDNGDIRRLKAKGDSTAIVVMPHLHSKDRRKAFRHHLQMLAKKGLRISLVACEWTDYTPPGTVGMLRKSQITAYLAFGSKDALAELTKHSYVREGNWYYPTNQRVPGMLLALARTPRAKGKDDKPEADMSGWQQCKDKAESDLNAIGEAYQEADQWIAENVESADDADMLSTVRELLCAWFLENALPPDGLETLAEFAEGVEWM